MKHDNSKLINETIKLIMNGDTCTLLTVTQVPKQILPLILICQQTIFTVNLPQNTICQHCVFHCGLTAAVLVLTLLKATTIFSFFCRLSKTHVTELNPALPN